jgi:hypothetical protein
MIATARQFGAFSLENLALVFKGVQIERQSY